MALAMSKAGPLRPDIKLSQALRDYEAVLSKDQKRSFHDTSKLDPNDVMILTFEINRQNAGRKSRTWGARLTTFLNSVKAFTSVVDAIVGSMGNPIAGAVWGTVKTAMQVSIMSLDLYTARFSECCTLGEDAINPFQFA